MPDRSDRLADILDVDVQGFRNRGFADASLYRVQDHSMFLYRRKPRYLAIVSEGFIVRSDQA